MDIIGTLLVQFQNFIVIHGNEGVFAIGLGILIALGGCSMGRKK